MSNIFLTIIKSNKKGTLLALILLILLALFYIKMTGCLKKVTSSETPPLDISLNCIPGTSTEPSILIVRLFSQKLRQSLLNRTVDKDAIELNPIEIVVNKNIWEKNISFMVSDKKESQSKKINKGIEIFKAPPATKLSFTAEDTYQIFYKIAPASVPAPRKKIQAILKIGKYTIKSNILTISEEPATKYDQLLRKARISLFLKDEKKTMAAAETLITAQPKAVSGYWYKGRAFELKEDYKQALAAYEQALKNTTQLKKGVHKEPPILILERIKWIKKENS